MIHWWISSYFSGFLPTHFFLLYIAFYICSYTDSSEMFVEFGSEQFLCHFVNFFIYSFINTRDHSWNQGCTVAVIVMNDQFHAMVMVVTIDTLVSIKEKLTEHIHTDKCGVLCTPVIMMENNIRYVIMQESLPLPH